MMDQKLLRTLNDLFGRELGRNLYEQPLFQWEWSEDLFWPARRTGRMIPVDKPVELPILGLGGGTETTILGILQPEYVRDRMTRLTDRWFVTRWLSPAELIYQLGLGRGQQNPPAPPDGLIEEIWAKQSPGVDFPSQGWRIPTDAWLPRSPEDPSEPNLPDTEHFIQQVKLQNSMNPEALLRDMLAQMESQEARTQAEGGEIARECFPAFLNPHPGKRGGFVSMPGIERSR